MLFTRLALAPRRDIRVALVALTAVAVLISVGMAMLAVWLTTTGVPGAVIPESQIWVNTLVFSTIIPAVVCPIVIHALLRTLRDLHQARAELDAIARRDPLTGLLNRRGFDQAADALMSRATAKRETAAAVVCDIDHFKRINDTFGHECGDKAIRHVATLLEAAAASCPDAALGRQGGEEFALVTAGCSVRELQRIAEVMRRHVDATPFEWESRSIHLTISVGTSMAVDTEADIKGLLSRADQALYEAKRRGRNRVEQADLAQAA